MRWAVGAPACGRGRCPARVSVRTVVFDEVVHLLAAAALEGVSEATLAAAEARGGRVAHGTHEKSEQQQPSRGHPCLLHVGIQGVAPNKGSQLVLKPISSKILVSKFLTRTVRTVRACVEECTCRAESSSQPTTHPRNPFLSSHSPPPQAPLPTCPTSMRALSLFLLMGSATAALRSTDSGCNLDDAKALVKLRAATAGDTWTITWPGTDPCPWTSKNATYVARVVACDYPRKPSGLPRRHLMYGRRVLSSSRLSAPV